MNQALLRKIPKVDAILSSEAMQKALAQYPYAFVKAVVQSGLEGLRAAVLEGSLSELPARCEIEQSILKKLQAGNVYHLKRVINGTGVVLHTNLGRSPLGEIGAHIADVAQGYSNLEFDLEAGARGTRYAHVETLLCEATGAEAAMVVNNNAGAVFLMLNTLAKGKRVAISRGELVEIGGSFRVPEIMEQSGAELVEIGTTNKTHRGDYERAIAEKGASVLLKVHTSNFTMQGFTDEVELAELVQLGREHGCPVLYDAGAAFLFAPELLGLHQGTTVKKCVEAGADIVCFSGDKLLGSAQAGIIVGKKAYIEKLQKNQLTRMLRIDKLSLAALEASLFCYREPHLAMEKIPILAMIAMGQAECRERAERLCALVQGRAPGIAVSCVPVSDEVGGGSLPDVLLNGYALRVECGALAPEKVEGVLRSRAIPIITRIHKGGILISVRTLFQEDEPEIAEAFAELSAQEGRG